MLFSRILKAIFFSNIFYGCCAVALCIETAYQQKIAIASPWFYCFIFCVTIVYYTYAYLHQYQTINITTNERTHWYFKHRTTIRVSQYVLTILIGIMLCLFGLNQANTLLQQPFLTWFVFCIFPALALLYYLKNMNGFQWLSLRNYGLIKPFLIAFIWAGTASILPLLYHNIFNQAPFVLTAITVFLFAKNWLFIAVLCILFDIKDYADDFNLQLKTFVVRLGLRKTLFNIVLPITFCSWILFLILAILAHFPLLRIVFNAIPFILLITVCYRMYQRKSILYYLAIIDGLMLVKAICGITGMILFK